ncbi:MAG: YIP1 family protein [Candidatus ainarchaeum sp.]|nr:YIP1 family protein [Candidatus ainarchaeum sp.]
MEKDIVGKLRMSVESLIPDKHDGIIEKNKKGGNFQDSVMLVAIAALLYSIVGGAASILILLISGLSVTGLGLVLVSLVIGFIFTVGFFAVNQHILKFIATSMNVKGNFDEQCYSLALITSGALVINTALAVINVIPCLGQLVSLIAGLALALWMLYLYYKIIKKVYSTDSTKAATILIADIVVVFIIAFVVSFILSFVLAFLGLGAALFGSFALNG